MRADSRELLRTVKQIVTHNLRIRVRNGLHVVSNDEVSTSARKVGLNTNRRYTGGFLNASQITMYVVVLI